VQSYFKDPGPIGQWHVSRLVTPAVLRGGNPRGRANAASAAPSVAVPRACYDSRVPTSAVIFDFDGLIIDSETPLFDIWASVYASHGAELSMEEWQHALGTQGGFDPFAHLSTMLERTLDRDTLAIFVREEHWRLCGDQPLLPGVRERMDEARALSLGVAVASSSPSSWVRPWLERHDLMPRVDAVCTREDVHHVKPAPDLFLLAARRMHVEPASCLVFEDSPNGLRAAHAAGMQSVAVPNSLTRGLPLPDPHLVLASMADMTLGEILERLEAGG
jgi:HAD superfamily hydrolase (TIGR01509 family)